MGDGLKQRQNQYEVTRRNRKTDGLALGATTNAFNYMSSAL
jgi:hypothetical protein